MRKVLSFVRAAIDDYNLIENNDKIAVGVSGGKDSMLLLSALSEMRRFYGKKFSICAITIDCGFEGMSFDGVLEFCKEQDIEYHIIKTEIAKIVFDIRNEKNPCSLCARMRRGSLHEAAKSFGCNKVALGHNFDDLAQTFLMNIFYEGRLSVFAAKTYLDRSDITLIRPLLYMSEREVTNASKRLLLPIVSSTCKANGNTKRQYAKELIEALEKETPDIKEKIFTAICKAELCGYKSKKEGQLNEQN